MCISLTRAGATKSFKTVEAAAEWLLAQAGVQNLVVGKKGNGVWALCEVKADGSKQALVESSGCNGSTVRSTLLRKFCDDWSEALGFDCIVPQKKSSRRKAGRQSGGRIPNYMLSERAYIAAFGY